MITILLSGGLGNQMFQFAAGKALAIRLNKSLTLDVYSFQKESTTATPRTYDLNVFDIENIRLSCNLKSKIITKLRPYIISNQKTTNILNVFADKRALRYDQDFERLQGNIILTGYFQNERYFIHIGDIIRDNFQFKTPLTDKNLEISRKIFETQSISIHIRRGDYIKNSNAASIFETCSGDYYHSAITLMTQKVSKPHFFVFSDDITWVKENICFQNHPCIFIEWNEGKNSYIDMQLMSLCKHNIIANSTFSWWGAWLNNTNNKIVIAPKKWLKNNFDFTQFPGYVPDNWIKL